MNKKLLSILAAFAALLGWVIWLGAAPPNQNVLNVPGITVGVLSKVLTDPGTGLQYNGAPISGALTPWTSDINGGGFSLTNAASVVVGGSGPSVFSGGAEFTTATAGAIAMFGSVNKDLTNATSAALQTAIGSVYLPLSGGTLSGTLHFSGTSTLLDLPSLTTAQKNAATGVAGSQVYDSDLGRVQMYDGANWHSRVRLDGDTMSGALLTTSTTTNSPSTNELVTAYWVAHNAGGTTTWPYYRKALAGVASPVGLGRGPGGPAGSGTAGSLTKTYCLPFFSYNGGTITNIGLNINAAVANSAVSIGIYANTNSVGDLNPASLVGEGDSLDCNQSAGYHGVTCNITLAPSTIYWAAVSCSNAIPNCFYVGSAYPANNQFLDETGNRWEMEATRSYTVTMPASLPAVSINNGNAPIVYVMFQ